MVLLLIVAEILLALIFIIIWRSNILIEDNTSELKSLNRNISNFNDREDLITVIKDLNKKIKELN